MIDSPSPSSTSSNQQQTEIRSSTEQPPLTVAYDASMGKSFLLFFLIMD